MRALAPAGKSQTSSSEESGVTGITFDTGALIALERRGQRMREVAVAAGRTGRRMTVPAAVLVEWWRGRSHVRQRILEVLVVEPLSEGLARLAGEALAAVASATAVDAIVMASAALRGDVVYTSDVSDLEKLRRHFPAVRLFSA